MENGKIIPDSETKRDTPISKPSLDEIRPTASPDVGEILQKPDGADVEKQKTIEGDAFFHRLGWKRLTIVLIVQAIALGSLSLPAAFATLGMVAGTIITVGMGFIAIYASYMVGLVKLKYPHIAHYADVGGLLLGKPGDILFSTIFVALLVMVVGSHCLTGTIAFVHITGSDMCSLVFSIISALILILLAIPPSFAEVAILGYIDFASIIIAIGITVIGTGINHSNSPASASDWSAWPKEDVTAAQAFVAISNIVFSYAFAAAQPSFMDEMHTPEDFTKSITALGVAQICIYTLTGALVYAFVGQDVGSPALVSAGPLLSKIAFGVALPVIYISGSINTTVACRFIHGRLYAGSVTRYVNTARGWISWLACVVGVTLLSWIIAEAIPFFSELLSICGALFISGLSFYIPPMMWFFLLKEEHWYDKKNRATAICNLLVFLVGIIVLGCGSYASFNQVVENFRNGLVKRPFSCNVGQ
ncbi:transmembrane amino acid transporter protein-domain-containing protein [Plectosphaerella cucumerina]|uniref:Transmembrane amino acid transporter protein-domain-containing protein n=1 Tax=Plectosphaerella cucumerina TaxID=40658 RepID=A0A8K0WZE0_9PEZI|nr:transmembrane amino acid transporter protein-domain-containing protein [Plectosphaerella cucumerina]